MRAFFLVDPADPENEYSLTMNTHFFYSPQGLGFEEENTYRQIGGNFILANTKPKQSVISGNIHFGGSTPYSRYRDFLAYCSRPNIQLAYYTGEGSAKDKLRKNYIIHAGTGFTETIDGVESYYPGVLELDGNTVGGYFKRYYANAYYEMQSKTVTSTHILYQMQSAFYASSPYKTYTNSRGVAEAYAYKFASEEMKNNTNVFCNILPNFYRNFNPSESYYTNQVFKTCEIEEVVTASQNDRVRVKYSNNQYRWTGSSWAEGWSFDPITGKLIGNYLGESVTEISAGSTTNPISIKKVNIVFCIRADALAGRSLGAWASNSSAKGLQFYCERAG